MYIGGAEARSQRKGGERTGFVYMRYRWLLRGPLSPSSRNSEKRWGARADQRPSCPRSQTNHREHPTNRNYIQRIPTNRNYSWGARLFLNRLVRGMERGWRGMSGYPQCSQADPSSGERMGQPGDGGAWRVTWWSRGSEVVLQQSSQRADMAILLSPWNLAILALQEA